MRPILHRPGPPLRDFVDCFWLWDGYPAPAPHERALPSGTVDLVINLAEDRLRIHARDDLGACTSLPGAMVTGACADYFVIGTQPCVTVMGVHFRPGGAFPFLGVPAGDLEGQQLPLAALWGADASVLRERLISAPGSVHKFALLEQALLARASRPLLRHPAVLAALRAFEDPSLRSVAEASARAGRTPRQLLALFHDEVGLTPKAFWRVRRFQAALRRVEAAAPVQHAELAAALGYCDQAHFNREFHHFTGLSPRAYRAQGVERPNHVPLRG